MMEKHNDEAMLMLLKHSDRQLTNDSNLEIVSEKSALNYSITLDHGGMTDMEYYKKMVDNSYLYGRGSKREAEAVTCCSWVITLPKEVSDYSTVEKTEISIPSFKQEELCMIYIKARIGLKQILPVYAVGQMRRS